MDSKSVKIKSFAAATFAAALISAHGADIVAHRGENSQAPENSIPAFKAAFANGADFIEGDFYLLENGEMICLHGQGELEKLAGIKKPLMKLNKDDLRSIDLASAKFKHLSPVRIPTLSEVFAAIPKGKSIFLEIKNYPKGFFEKLEAERKAAGIGEEQISLIAFDFNALKDAKARNPRYKCYFLYNTKKVGDKITPSADEIADRVKSANLDGVDVACWGVDKGYISALKSRGLYVAVWTVNNPKDMEKFVEWGADSITTDKSGDFIKILNKFSQHSVDGIIDHTESKRSF